MSSSGGCGRGSELASLWLWPRRATAALIQPLALEHPYAAGTAMKRKTTKKNQLIFSAEILFSVEHRTWAPNPKLGFSRATPGFVRRIQGKVGSIQGRSDFSFSRELSPVVRSAGSSPRAHPGTQVPRLGLAGSLGGPSAQRQAGRGPQGTTRHPSSFSSIHSPARAGAAAPSAARVCPPDTPVTPT